MVRTLSILAAAGLYALIRLLLRRPLAVRGAELLLRISAAVLPVVAALTASAWEPLCLIPILSLESWLDLPGRVRRQIPREAGIHTAMIWPEAIADGGPRVLGLCAPFQLEGADRRRGGDVLFNTALALCADESDMGEGLAAYAAQQGFDRSRLTARMPLVSRRREDGLTYAVHQDRGAVRTFVMGEPHLLLPRCKWVLDGRERLMAPGEDRILWEALEQMQGAGLQVYAFALAGEGGMTYLGLAGLAVCVRPGAFERVKRLERLGARPILLGRGSRQSVRALAGEAGLLRPGDRLVTCEELQRMDDDRLVEEVRAIGAYADLDSPSRKRVINAWEQWGEDVLLLEEEGLEEWERALKTGRRLEKAAARFAGEAPLMTFAPCALTVIGAALDLWPVCLLSVAMSVSLWAWLVLGSTKAGKKN